MREGAVFLLLALAIVLGSIAIILIAGDAKGQRPMQVPILHPDGHPNARRCPVFQERGLTAPDSYERVCIEWRQPRGVGDTTTPWTRWLCFTTWPASLELPTSALTLTQIRYRFEDIQGLMAPTPWVHGEVSKCSMIAP